jgi:putative flavoprotein involved in K+ transport
VWATGFTRDYRWLHAPVFDGAGRPQHLRGVSPVPGLYFLGLPWLHTWGSGRFAGIERDAAHIASQLNAFR